MTAKTHDATALARSFIRSHPERAALALLPLPAAQTAALLEDLTPSEAASLLQRLPGAYAAQVLASLHQASLPTLLAHLEPARAAQLMRPLERARRESILRALPAPKAGLVRLSLSHPMDTVGAWMDPRVLTAHVSQNVADARALLRAWSGGGAHHLYLLDDLGRPGRMVTMAALVHVEPQEALAALASNAPAGMGAHTRLAVAYQDAIWSDHAQVPVVDARGRLVGVIEHRILQRAFTATPTDTERPLEELGQAVAGLADAYWSALAGVFDLGGDLLRAVVRTGREP